MASNHETEFLPIRNLTPIIVAIIDPDTFAAVQEERFRRASALGRIRQPKEDKVSVHPTTFHIIKGAEFYDDPFAQAAYAYSLIESEV